MSLSAAPFEKVTLAKKEDFHIELIVEDNDTPYVQLSHLPSQQSIFTIPIDPTDRTVAGSICEADLNLIDEKERGNILAFFSQTLQKELGAQEFLAIPDTSTLPNFIEPTEKDGLRQGAYENLLFTTKRILRRYRSLAATLDRDFHFVTQEKDLMNRTSPTKRYHEIDMLMKDIPLADSKRLEYKTEGMQGKRSRCRNKNIKLIAMLDKENKIVGMIRVLFMGNNFFYLSDCFMKQELCELSSFEKKSTLPPKNAREKFLLSYLIYKAIHLLPSAKDNHFMILAERTPLYESLGFATFPLRKPGFKIMILSGEPGPALQKLQDKIINAPLLREIAPLPCAIHHGLALAPLEEKQKTSYWKYGVTAVVIGLFALRVFNTQKKDEPILEKNTGLRR